MTSESHPEALAKAYVLRRQALAIQERQLTRNMLPPEEQLQIMWLEGLLGNELYDAEGHKINILESGHWNRGAGPDFLNARIQVNDKIIQGDIELDISPEDWEEHHHGSNANFDQVILHVVCLPPRQIWYTRTSQHKTVPWALVSQDHLINVLALPKAKQFMPLPGHCASMFLVMSRDQLEQTLLAAAAYRNELKKKTWQALVAAVGPQQALYEQTAEALGFHANKAAMHQLAKRVPLNKAQEYPEALLFGTAGFLSSNLPESCSEETRAYHKELWSVWWRFRDQFELAPERSISWIFSGIRPVNHPRGGWQHWPR